MELTEKTYVHTIWFVSWYKADLMASISREGNGNWILEYRFRYYTGKQTGDPFLDEDTKNFYRMELKDESELDKLIGLMDKMTKTIHTKEPYGTYSKLPIMGDAQKFSKILSKQSWAYVKVTPKESDAVN